MKLKIAMLLLSAFSSSVYAKTYNLSTVIHKGNINKIVDEMVKTFAKGEVDPNTPIGVSGTYELDDHNRLVAINVDHATFKVIKIPLVGTYQTDVTIHGTISAGNCQSITVTSSRVNSGNPEAINPIFTAYLKKQGSKALSIAIKNSDLNNYCVKSNYEVYFY